MESSGPQFPLQYVEMVIQWLQYSIGTTWSHIGGFLECVQQVLVISTAERLLKHYIGQLALLSTGISQKVFQMQSFLYPPILPPPANSQLLNQVLITKLSQPDHRMYCLDKAMVVHPSLLVHLPA